MSIVKKSFWLYFFSFLVAPTGYIIKMVLARNVGIEDFWLLYAVISFVTILSMVNDFGMTESLSFFLPKFLWKDKKKSSQLLVYSLGIQLCTSVIIGIGLFFLADFLGDWYFQNSQAVGILHIFILFFFLNNLYQILFSFFGSIRNPKLQKWNEFLRMFSVTLFVIGVSCMGISDISVYAWGWIFGLLISVVFWWTIVWTFFRDLFSFKDFSFDPDFFRSCMSYAFWVVLAVNVGTLLSQLDMQMIVYFLGTESAGYYSVYLSIMRIPFVLVVPGIAFLFPIISHLYAEKKIESIAKIRSFMFHIFFILGIFTSFVLFFYGKDFVSLLFWEEFMYSSKILLFSVPFLVFNFLLQTEFQIMVGTGQAKNRLFVFLKALVLNFILNRIFITPLVIGSFSMGWNLGAPGAALATGIGWVYIFSQTFFYTKEYPVTIDFSMIFKNSIVLASFFMVFLFFPKVSIYFSLFFLVLFCILFLGIFSFLNRKYISTYISYFSRAWK